MPRWFVALLVFLAPRIFKKWKLPVFESIRRGLSEAKRRESRFEGTWPPDGVDVHLRSLVLWKVVPREYYAALRRWLINLFPDIVDDSSGLLHDLDIETESISGTFGHEIGVVTRPKRGLIGPRTLRELTTLPSSVRFVEVLLSRPSPSFYVLVLKVTLEDNFGNTLKSVPSSTMAAPIPKFSIIGSPF
jgi:hypothetical protein